LFFVCVFVVQDMPKLFYLFKAGQKTLRLFLEEAVAVVFLVQNLGKGPLLRRLCKQSFALLTFQCELIVFIQLEIFLVAFPIAA
jgi:hypothetical protein